MNHLCKHGWLLRSTSPPPQPPMGEGVISNTLIPNPDELTSHLTKLQKTQQVIGYPPMGERSEGGEAEQIQQQNRALHFASLSHRGRACEGAD
jgi:hypothetical protein